MRTIFRIFLTIVVLLMAIFPVTPALAAGATLSLSPATGTFNQGCSFSLDILLDTGGSQVDGADIIILYDSTRFTATAVRHGTIFSDYPGDVIDTQNGKISVAGMSSGTSSYTGSGTFATVDFTVLSNAPAGASKISFDFDPNDKGKTNDSNIAEHGTVTDILNQVNNGTYTIGSGSCTSQGITGGSTGGSTIGGKGGAISTPAATPVPTKSPVLPDSADLGTTVLVAAVGGFLTLIGILGVAFL